jgi:hypothetical protein
MGPSTGTASGSGPGRAGSRRRCSRVRPANNTGSPRRGDPTAPTKPATAYEKIYVRVTRHARSRRLTFLWSKTK